MDDLSSPVSITSTTTTTPTTVKTTPASQPTYTTAGTLYNPTSSQPLQPPARRGRSLKWSNSGAYSGLTLLPKSFLASLPVNGGSTGSPVTPAYTPLQQNYDRAVSPMIDPEYIGGTILAKAPSMKSENTPTSPSGLAPDSEHNRDERLDDEDTSDDDDGFMVETLINMPVKSLQNLASYPNPTQKKAQKALRRGARPARKALPADARGNGMPTYSTRLLGASEVRRENSISPTLQRSSQVASALRRDPGYRALVDYRRNVTAKSDDRFHNATFNGSAPGLRSSMTLASGPGAPRPLTAGPPGLRQYRPLTFESTYQTLQPKQVEGIIDETRKLTVSRRTIVQAGIDDASHLSESSSSPFKLTDAGSPAVRGPLPDGAVVKDGPLVEGVEDVQSQSFSLGKKLTVKSNVAASKYGAMSMSMSKSPARDTFLPSVLGVRYQAGTDRMTDETIKARMDKINQEWYAGAKLLTRTADQIVEELRPGWKNRGEARPIGSEQSNPKYKQYNRPIEIPDANRMSVAEHAQPLLNMAMGRLMLEQEEQKLSKKPKKGPAFWPLP